MGRQRAKSIVTLAVVFVFIIGLGTVSFWLWHGRHPAPGDFAQPDRLPMNQTTPVQALKSAPEANEPAKLEAVWKALAATTASATARKELDELRRYLSALPPEAAVAAIRQFLDSREDASSNLGFAIGRDGFLTAAPSLRVFLLDYLAHVDRQAASRYAETILSTMGSPDEWAISLRNYALASATPQAGAFLERKMQKLLRYEPWQNHPSTAYLEAFDVAVHLGGTNLMPVLTQLVRQTDNRAVAHGAYLALDRLTISNPAATLEHLLNDPDAMRGREQTRANYFARANVADRRQRQILENYLLAPDRSTAELQTFAGLFPNANFMVSQNLLTSVATPDHDTLARRDSAALQMLVQWMTDSRFERLQPQLRAMRSRLEMFVNQTPGN